MPQTTNVLISRLEGLEDCVKIGHLCPSNAGRTTGTELWRSPQPVPPSHSVTLLQRFVISLACSEAHVPRTPDAARAIPLVSFRFPRTDSLIIGVLRAGYVGLAQHPIMEANASHFLNNSSRAPGPEGGQGVQRLMQVASLDKPEACIVQVHADAQGNYMERIRLHSLCHRGPFPFPSPQRLELSSAAFCWVQGSCA